MSILSAAAHAAAGTSRSSVRVAAVDLQHSRRRSSAVFGPMALPSRDVAVRRLREMIAAGPAFRLGLVPSASQIRWRTTASDIADSVTEVAPLARDGDPLTLLETVRSLPDAGVRIVLAGDTTAIDFSHGLGDVAFAQAVVDVMLGGVPLTDTHWDPYRRRGSRLLTAAARTFGSDPRRLVDLARFHHRRLPAAPVDAGRTRTIAHSAPDARTVRLSDDDVAALRSLRDRHLPGVSMFVIHTCALLAALDDAGIATNRDVTIPFDARPYLPASMGTLASFSAGLAFPLDVATRADELQAMMTAAARMGRPVANLAVSTVKVHLARRSHLLAAEDPRTVPATAPRADLLHSFVGRIPQTTYSPFTDPDRAATLIVSDPVSPAGITVTSATSGDNALCVTAAFHPSVFDGERIGSALSGLADHAKRVITA
ncbi:hypothetical protein [Gordonia sp. OPL2]|uniref:hypothetical protein n=1 Tax=Gordonia sp. OPL2 TaxID=2486274 RepID=UPI001655BD9D|nr:hypothetical protein [Gordonia sp. OPL2]RPA02607.1 hypothetical protein EEB19_11225 [Gordonia sp. OPL2]